jgi:hypothetical protein
LCDRCVDDGRPFLACSLACLEAHDAAEHDHPRASASRVVVYQAAVNRNVAKNRRWYAGHRARVSALLGEASRGGELCVLGAGNGSDLDLPALAKRFSAIHLVDLDGEALERCRAGARAGLRERLVLHAGVDLSGFTAHLDGWGDAFPAAAELGAAAQPAIHGILRALGRTFDVVASTCALSQLAVPYHRAWILPARKWAELHATITAVHLATIAGAAQPGGTGILIFDVLSSRTEPGLRALADEPESLEAFLDARRGPPLEPDPASLLARMETLGRLVARPRLTAPWLWNIGAETQLVYGLVFARA